MLNTHGSLLGFRKYLPAGAAQIPYNLYDLLTLKSAAKRADAIVVSSRFEREDAVEFGIRPERIHILPMGIDLPEPVDRANHPDGPLKILFVGRLARVRRVELLLHAIRGFGEDCEVAIVGGEEETSSLARSGYLSELKALSAELEIAHRVTFTGPLRGEALQAQYRAADVFVYPSLYENFSQPILEAAAAGLPVIATSVGVARELVEDGITGFFIEADPHGIADRLRDLSSKPDRLKMGNAIRARVEAQFSWPRIMQGYQSLYQSLL